MILYIVSAVGGFQVGSQPFVKNVLIKNIQILSMVQTRSRPMSESEYKKEQCPYCGSVNTRRVSSFDVKPNTTIWQRECDDCGDVYDE